MAPPNFPVKYTDIKAKMTYLQACPTEFEIGSVKVTPIPISHPNSGSGYKFIEDGKTFVFLTDNELGYIHPGGLTYDDYREFSRGADLLIHDAEYAPAEYKVFRDWGHSVYTDVLKLAAEAGVEKLGLFHLNQDRTDRAMDGIVKTCRQILAKRGNRIKCFAVRSGMTFDL
jgi:phosphoribosyl 1,2-cyclic phosphodiesterase